MPSAPSQRAFAPILDAYTRSVNPKRSFDLVNVVCPNLADFANNVDAEIDAYFIIWCQCT